MRKWAGLGLGMGMTVAMLTAFACGGTEETTSSSSGGTEAGSDSTTTTDASNQETSVTNDAAFDGNINAPEVSLTFGTCPAFTACGGDEKGNWKVSGGCLSDSILADGQAACPGLTTSDEVIKAKGTVDVDGTTIVRHTQVKLTAKAFVPNTGQCAQGIALGGCAALGTLGAGQLGFDKMTCADAADGGSSAGCDCTIEKTVTANENTTYTKSGNTITTEAEDTFDYCVAGSKLTYTQTNAQSGGQDPLPLYIELSK